MRVLGDALLEASEIPDPAPAGVPHFRWERPFPMPAPERTYYGGMLDLDQAPELALFLLEWRVRVWLMRRLVDGVRVFSHSEEPTSFQEVVASLEVRVRGSWPELRFVIGRWSNTTRRMVSSPVLGLEEHPRVLFKTNLEKKDGSGI